MAEGDEGDAEAKEKIAEAAETRIAEKQVRCAALTSVSHER